ncbi:MAG: toxin ParE1/3/4 [Gaiellaceae bacterium]|jgi:plasmid stabilization system protein ParE|nr:toxin ParE1/3/4 [Gaiellaceae bacterium]
MKVRYTDTAATEVEEILDYIGLHNRVAAVQVNARLKQTASVLADFPDIAQMSDEPGVRQMPIGRYPLMMKTTSLILHVRHTAREPL